MSQIVTTTSLAAYMNKTLVDAMAQRVVDAVNQWIENYTKRAWGETRTIIERYDWSTLIWLRHQDVQSIGYIKSGYPGQQQSTLDPTGYFLNELGRITLYLQSPRLYNPSQAYNDLLEIEYTYGVLEVPEDLAGAAHGVAAGFYNWAADGNKDVVAASVGSYRLEFAGKRPSNGGSGSGSTANNVTDVNWQIITSYVTRRQ